MLTEVVVATATGLTSGYGLLTGIVALIASAHPDERRRADAAKVLDRLLRRVRR